MDGDGRERRRGWNAKNKDYAERRENRTKLKADMRHPSTKLRRAREEGRREEMETEEGKGRKRWRRRDDDGV
jgi:hypothetical protein